MTKFMKITSSEQVVYINCSKCQNKKQFMYTTCSELVIFMCWNRNKMYKVLSYCGLVDARIRASDKDLSLQGGRSMMLFRGAWYHGILLSFFIVEWPAQCNTKQHYWPSTLYKSAAFQKTTCYHTKTNQIHIKSINSPVKDSGEFQQNWLLPGKDINKRN